MEDGNTPLVPIAKLCYTNLNLTKHTSDFRGNSANEFQRKTIEYRH